jgi:hypothetical protein
VSVDHRLLEPRHVAVRGVKSLGDGRLLRGRSHGDQSVELEVDRHRGSVLQLAQDDSFEFVRRGVRGPVGGPPHVVKTRSQPHQAGFGLAPQRPVAVPHGAGVVRPVADEFERALVPREGFLVCTDAVRLVGKVQILFGDNKLVGDLDDQRRQPGIGGKPDLLEDLGAEFLQ